MKTIVRGPAVRQALSILRQEAGLNQAEFAELLGVNQSTVSRWEQGYGLPRVVVVITEPGDSDSGTVHLEFDTAEP